MHQDEIISAHARHVRFEDLADTVVNLDHSGQRIREEYGKLSFHEWKEEDVISFLGGKGYSKPKRLADGSWCAIVRLFTTFAVCTDVSQSSPYAYRWCFKTEEAAEKFLDVIENFDDVPEDTSQLRGHRYHDLPRMVGFDKNGFSRW